MTRSAAIAVEVPRRQGVAECVDRFGQMDLLLYRPASRAAQEAAPGICLVNADLHCGPLGHDGRKVLAAGP